MAASQRAQSRPAWNRFADRVRYAEPAEFDDVADLLLRANRAYRGLLPAPVYRAYLDELGALVRDPAMLERCEILVAGPSGGVQGCVAFCPDLGGAAVDWPRGWAGLRALAVDPNAHGLGLGRRLVETAIGRARMIGAPAIALHSAAFQTAARRLFLELGFVRWPQFDLDAADSGQRPAEAFALRL